MLRILFILLPAMALCQSDKGFQPREGLGIGAGRVALVIGNGNYPTAPLQNAVADARSMKAFLREAGFRVHYQENADRRAMKRVVDEFKRDLDEDSVGLFFYSGHGIQVEGVNYLVPVDVAPRDEDDVSFDCYPAGKIINKMSRSGTRMNLVILDACRNNPFSSGFKSQTRGLAMMDASDGTLIAYATGPNKVASDGGRLGNGLYTHHLLDVLKVPGLTLEQIFKRTARSVADASGRKQIPWYHSSILDDFYFVPRKTPRRDPVEPEQLSYQKLDLLQEAIGFFSGTGGTIDINRGRILFSEAAATGDPLSKMWMGYLIYEGKCGFGEDEPKGGALLEQGLPEARKLAEKGNREAMFLLGMASRYGLTGSEDAGPWFRKAAVLGHARSQYLLGTMYRDGQEFNISYETAAIWFRKAADLGSAAAMVSLGYSYDKGRGVKESKEEAVKWYRKAAEIGEPQGQYNLGWSYKYGEGVAKSLADAFKWYRKAAEQEHDDGQNGLGTLYEYGNGTPQDYEKAVYWYRKAADQGNGAGQYNLADMYEYGKGVKKSRSKAIELYRKAARQSFEKAQKALTRLGETW